MTNSWATGWVTGDIPSAAEFAKGVGAIYDTTLSVASANIDIPAIVASYAHLRLELVSRTDSAVGITSVGVRFNGDTAANYYRQWARGTAATASANEALAQTSLEVGTITGASATASLPGQCTFDIVNFRGTTFHKLVTSQSFAAQGTASGNLFTEMYGGLWKPAAPVAITQITLIPASGNFIAGTRCTVYAYGA